MAANAVLGVAKPHLLDCTEWDVPDQRRRECGKLSQRRRARVTAAMAASATNASGNPEVPARPPTPQ